MKENEIGKVVVDCAVRLHMEIGPVESRMGEVKRNPSLNAGFV